VGDDDHRGVGPERSGDGGDAVGDAGTVLTDDHAMTTGDPGVAVCHVSGALFVDHRHEPDARRSEDVHRVHKGGSHNAKGVGNAVGNEGFHKGFAGCHSGHVKTL
jgi:hypothetical protein